MKRKTLDRHATTADLRSVPSELILGDLWDAEAVAGLIRSKSDCGYGPSFLFLGRKETSLLRAHLAEAFGEESVSTLHDTYYQGLEVVSIDCDSFLATAGCKAHRTWQNPIARRPAWRDEATEALWQFRI